MADEAVPQVMRELGERVRSIGTAAGGDPASGTGSALMDEGTIQLIHNGHTYHGRWNHDDTDVLTVWASDFGPLSTIVGSRTADGQPCLHTPPESLARRLLREFLEEMQRDARRGPAGRVGVVLVEEHEVEQFEMALRECAYAAEVYTRTAEPQATDHMRQMAEILLKLHGDVWVTHAPDPFRREGIHLEPKGKH